MTVYVISRSQTDFAAIDEFLKQENVSWSQTGGSQSAEALVELAGRVCYMSFGTKQSPRSNREYIENLVKMGHESVLEHASWTFLITEVSRSFTHQLVRHRVGFSFSQLSQQYHDETEATFVEPIHLASYPAAREAWFSATAKSKEAYQAILHAMEDSKTSENLHLDRRELKRAMRSAARSVLPNATSTKIVVTANARAIRHFLRVRGTVPGDIEMRVVASALLTAVQAEAPSLFFDFEVSQLPDGPIIIHNAGS